MAGLSLVQCCQCTDLTELCPLIIKYAQAFPLELELSTSTLPNDTTNVFRNERKQTVRTYYVLDTGGTKIDTGLVIGNVLAKYWPFPSCFISISHEIKPVV